jgi:CRISPR-associated endoribonuclease Cas6
VLPPEPGLPKLATPDRLHALACTLFETEASRHTDGAKPFAVRPLLAACVEVAGWELGLCWLAEHPPPPAIADGITEVRFGPRSVPVLATTVEQVALATLAGGPRPERVRFDVLSPALFSRNGSDYPRPDPAVVYTSLARRLPDPQDPAHLRELAAAVRLYRHDIHTQPVTWHGQRTAGFVGTVVFGLSAQASAQAAQLFTTTSRFAGYAGLGHGTTHGLGAVNTTPTP